tara:strand:+ start:2589 stop:3032 length:444 start_codon:yes stop_codon:yes gene_type:complete
MEVLVLILIGYIILTFFDKKSDNTQYPTPSQNTKYKNAVTPNELAKKLGISPRTLRQWLRENYTRPLSQKNERWYLTDIQIEAATNHFTRTRKTQRRGKRRNKYNPGQYKRKPKVSPESYLDPISWESFVICEYCGSENRKEVTCCK